MSELPARMFIPEPLGGPRRVVCDPRTGHTRENRHGQEGSGDNLHGHGHLLFSDWSLGMSLGARLMARDLMQLGSPRNSPDGLAATGQDIGAGYGPYRWRDCVDAKTGVTGAPLKMRRNREADMKAEDGGRSGSCCENSITPSSPGNALLRHAGCFAPSSVPRANQGCRMESCRCSGSVRRLATCNRGCSASRRATVPIQ
jgi:hypothetical protein